MAEYSMQEAIKKMLAESHWKSRYQIAKLKQDWELLMGKMVARYTNDLQFRDGILYVYSDVAALKNELSYNKALLIERLNQHLDEKFIKEIIVR